MIIIVFTGLSGSGKTTLANLVKEDLIKTGFPVEVLDGDICRKYISSDLGFSKEDRMINLKRIGYIASLLYKHKIITIIAAINPYEETRNNLFADNVEFRTIWIRCGLETLIKRDCKGLYQRALLPDNDPMKIYHFTGISDVFEEPQQPDLIIDTDIDDISTSKNKIVTFLMDTISNL